MKLELLIPTTISEIPLKHYQAFKHVAETSNDEEFIAEKMIELFCGIQLKEVVKIKAKDMADMVEHLNKIFSVKQSLVNKFTIGGVEFGFITDLENISWGEYIDIERNLTDMNTMHKAMAAMYRPITKRKGDKYEIEEYNGTINYAEVMKFAPLNVVFGASVFFWNLGKELLLALTDSLETEMKTMELTTTPNTHNLESDGVGINQSIHLLKETLHDLMTLPENHWLNV